jgi:hypothetical protein
VRRNIRPFKAKQKAPKTTPSRLARVISGAFLLLFGLL